MNNLCTLTAQELSTLLNKREISSFELIEQTFQNISISEPKINAFITLNYDKAIKKAKEIDELRVKNVELNPLAGIPISIKDNICTKGIKTTCASKMLENFIPPYNATVIDKIEQAGLIIVGKTNMDEFGMGSSSENSAFKVTGNPKNLTRVSGGSSGGSAASVAANMVPLSLGTDTGGSIRLPSSFCGIIGLKPTYGLVSRYGLIAYASSLDQIGPLSRSVIDNALLLNIIAGYDPKDSTSINVDIPNYSNGLKNLTKLKIGVIKETFEQDVDKDIKESILNQIKFLEDNNFYVKDVSLPTLKYSLAAYYLIATAEASSNLARYDGIRYGYRECEDEDIPLDQLYYLNRDKGFGREVKRRIMLGTFTLSAGYYDAYYKKARQVRTLIIKDFQRIFETVDILLSPVSPQTAFLIGSKVNDPLKMYLSDVFTVPINLANLPAMSIPCGLDSNNLPIGLQIIGKPLDESSIYSLAYFIEKNNK